MTQDQLGTVGIFLSALISTIGFVSFVTLARFHRSRGGWLVFWDLLMVTWVLDLASLAHLVDAPWFAWVRAGSFTVGMPAVLAWRLWIIFDLQLRARWHNPMTYRGADSRLAGQEEETR